MSTTALRSFIATRKAESTARQFGATPVTSIFLPKEHGSWSLALEPLALGLLVAPSPAGFALAAAALAGFFARRPLKAAFLPAGAARRSEARRCLALLGLLATVGLIEAVLLGGWTALWPLLLAAPLAALFTYFDSQGESRAAAAELAGCAAFALLPAALAALAGWPALAALALAFLALSRSLPTVLTIRTFLRLGKQQPAPAAPPLAISALAAAGAGLLATQELVPWTAAGFAALLLARTLWLVTPLRPVWPARRAGMFEAVLGLLYVCGIALAYRLH